MVTEHSRDTTENLIEPSMHAFFQLLLLDT